MASVNVVRSMGGISRFTARTDNINLLLCQRSIGGLEYRL